MLQIFVSKFSQDLAEEYKNRGIIVQCVLPGYVVTKMSKIRKASFFSPSPKTFVESALKTVGIESQTVGYWPHNIMVTCLHTRIRSFKISQIALISFLELFQPGALTTLSGISEKFISWNVMRSMLQIRSKALKYRPS